MSREIWKKQDRECPPCPDCGAELYEQFWGNGGWVKAEKAGDGERMHSERRCIGFLAARLGELQAAALAVVEASGRDGDWSAERDALAKAIGVMDE
jgi:hypothetical protein